MKKSIFIKLAILLVVAALVYGVFWFFKIGQIEKQIRSFVSENSTNVSVKEISVSGFPLSQKITIQGLKFTIPNQLLEGKQVIVSKLEAVAGVFSNEFNVSISDPVSVEYDEGTIGNVAFGKIPEIQISFANGRISSFRYKDFGYRILDAAQNVLYATSSSLIDIKTTIDEGDKIKTSGSVELKDIENFSVIDVYKSVFEKRIISGLKTGEIILDVDSPSQVDTSSTDQEKAVQKAVDNLSKVDSKNASEVARDVVVDAQSKVTNVIKQTAKESSDPKKIEAAIKKAKEVDAAVKKEVIPSKEVKKESVPTNNANIDAKSDVNKVDIANPSVSKDIATKSSAPAESKNNLESDTAKAGNKPISEKSKVQADQAVDNVVDSSKNKAAAKKVVGPEDMVAAVMNNELVKGNFAINFEYILTPNTSEEKLKIPADPTQIQDIPVQYSKTIKVSKMEFSNPIYKISMVGEMKTFVDDDMPSGSLKITINKLDNLVNYVSAAFAKILEQRFPTPIQEVVANSEVKLDPNSIKKIEAVNPAVDKTVVAQVANEPVIIKTDRDPYEIFLTSAIANLGSVSKEIAANNPNTKEGQSVFEVKREKNLEFLVNGSSIRELIGKL